ncbi:lef-8 [Clostera anastomosis granulovirus A]|uniref:Lef-8 n=1 Tax=Clostera anastomosis granulovirus A TaxID=1986289 RepID=U5KBB4_9BBAC|nr:lef-8 [Clostera anastomosis granulovirus Henan]AGQ20370.1 lef-8 [Clostera anastomosis granulovirus Henan]
MGVVEDFNTLYTSLSRDNGLTFRLTCGSPVDVNQLKTYFCCAIHVKLNKCVLHNCVVVIVGTWLDRLIRGEDDDDKFNGTFVIDGRNFSFPNIMMNNNVLVHRFHDKHFARDKNMKRMYLYGNYDDDNTVNRAIQMVYDGVDDVLHVRDVYAKDYIVDDTINDVLREYLGCSGKWPQMDFVFSFERYDGIFNDLKKIMSVDVSYDIDSLSNKLIYKHSYLVSLAYATVLRKMAVVVNDTLDKTVAKKKMVLFGTECKKIHDAIVMGKLIQFVSKTFSKQKKCDQDFNSNNNNLEVYPLRFRIGNEVLRMVNENMQQDMLKHTADYVKFVDSFFHGEMTVAGKKFFLCHNTVLPDVDYTRVATLFATLLDARLLFELNDEVGIRQVSAKDTLLVSFNNRPTKYHCSSRSLIDIYYVIKRNRTPVEIRTGNGVLFINHHEGMVMLKKVVIIDDRVRVNTLQTPYEFHNELSIVTMCDRLRFHDTPNENTTLSLMSTIILNYYSDNLHIFNTIPLAKLIVSLTNLKNGMVVYRACPKKPPVGHSVVVDPSIYCNDRMFYLWTLVMDSKLKTAEDPYIPHTHLPINIYHYKSHKLRGRVQGVDVACVYRKAGTNNAMMVEGSNYLFVIGTLISDGKVNWNHDGKKFKIEYCVSRQRHVYKIYLYVRKIKGQTFDRVTSEMDCDGNGGNVTVRFELVYHATDLEGLKICGIHGQKGVLHQSEDLSRFVAEDDPTVHAQICLSPISYLSRQTNFNRMPVKISVVDDVRYPLVRIPYMFFNNTPDNIYKEFIGKNVTGHEKLEGTRLDQWSINQSFVGNCLSEGLHCVRNGMNSLHESGQFSVFRSLLNCNNINVT